MTKIKNLLQKKHTYTSIIGLILLAGIYLRLHSINFGLPHSFHADEPEIVELAIKYTYETRSIIKEGNYYKLIPISYVYGMFPTYVFTLLTMLFSKSAGILNIPFKKEAIYIFLRVITALSSLLITFTSIGIYKKIYKKQISKMEVLGIIFLTSLNWKLIVHSHYVNMDLYLTAILNLTFLTIILYYFDKSNSFLVTISGLLFGLSIGTKITAALSLPLFAYIFLHKKDYRSLAAFTFLAYLGFALSNPFSLVFFEDFAYRILEMQTKEAGMVFDSVNSNPFKYIKSLIFISTPLIFIFSLYGNYISLTPKYDIQSKDKDEYNYKLLHIFLTGNILIYLLFFSLNAREISRWLLPILPLVLIYSIKGFYSFFNFLENKYKSFFKVMIPWFLLVVLSSYLYYPFLTVKQFNRHTPKSAAYIWMRDNISSSSNKLVITEEGLDPLNKLENSQVIKPKVYTTENAQYDFPPNPKAFDYIVLASKPMANYKRAEIQETYPFYSRKWEKFESEVNNSKYFTLIKKYTLPKPNLVNLSDIYIYKNKIRK